MLILLLKNRDIRTKALAVVAASRSSELQQVPALHPAASSRLLSCPYWPTGRRLSAPPEEAGAESLACSVDLWLAPLTALKGCDPRGNIPMLLLQVWVVSASGSFHIQEAGPLDRGMDLLDGAAGPRF